MQIRITAIIVLATIFFSCSSDDDSAESCATKIYQLEEICDTSSCSFNVTYGTSATTVTTVDVSEETYNYYEANFIPGETCWEGINAQ